MMNASPGPVILLAKDGVVRRLSREKDWRAVIRSGALRTEDLVHVERGPAMTAQRAGDVPELSRIFAGVALQEPGVAGVDDELDMRGEPNELGIGSALLADDPAPLDAGDVEQPARAAPEADAALEPSYGVQKKQTRRGQVAGIGILLLVVATVARCVSPEPTSPAPEQTPTQPIAPVSYFKAVTPLFRLPDVSTRTGEFMPRGSSAQYFSVGYGWVKLTSGQYAGYFAPEGYLSPNPPPVLSELGDTPIYVSRAADIRADANGDSVVLARVSEGDRLVAVGQTGDGWTAVQVPGQLAIGYVLTRALNEPTASAEEVAEPPTDALTESPQPQSEPPAAEDTGSSETTPTPTVITNPDWLRIPDADDMARYYPDRAQRLGQSGRVTISCTVRANGMLTECSVISEDPADMGFGDSAIRISRLFRMRPQTRDGRPVDGGIVRIPMSFLLPG